MDEASAELTFRGYVCASICRCKIGLCVRESGAGLQFCGKHCFHAERILLEIFLGREELGRRTGGESWGDLN